VRVLARAVGQRVDAVGEREQRAVDVAPLYQALAAVVRLICTLRAGEID